MLYTDFKKFEADFQKGGYWKYIDWIFNKVGTRTNLSMTDFRKLAGEAVAALNPDTYELFRELTKKGSTWNDWSYKAGVTDPGYKREIYSNAIFPYVSIVTTLVSAGEAVQQQMGESETVISYVVGDEYIPAGYPKAKTTLPSGSSQTANNSMVIIAVAAAVLLLVIVALKKR